MNTKEAAVAQAPAPAKPYDQIHLAAKNKSGKRTGLCGRGVRYRILTAAKLSHIEGQCSREMADGETRVEFAIRVATSALHAMVVEVSEPSTAEELPTAKWSKVSASHLDDHWDDYFGAKDTGILKQIYEQEHGFSPAEYDEIVAGKVSFAPEG